MPVDDDVDVRGEPKPWDPNGILTLGEQVTVIFAALREHVNIDLSRIHGGDCEVCGGKKSLFPPVPPARPVRVQTAPTVQETVQPTAEGCACGQPYTHRFMVETPRRSGNRIPFPAGYQWCAGCARAILRDVVDGRGVWHTWQIEPIPADPGGCECGERNGWTHRNVAVQPANNDHAQPGYSAYGYRWCERCADVIMRASGIRNDPFSGYVLEPIPDETVDVGPVVWDGRGRCHHLARALVNHPVTHVVTVRGPNAAVQVGFGYCDTCMEIARQHMQPDDTWYGWEFARVTDPAPTPDVVIWDGHSRCGSPGPVTHVVTVVGRRGTTPVGHGFCDACMAIIRPDQASGGIFWEGYEFAPVAPQPAPTPTVEVDPDLEAMIAEEEAIERQERDRARQAERPLVTVQRTCANCHDSTTLTHRITRFWRSRWTDDRICNRCARNLRDSYRSDYTIERLTACSNCGTADHPFTHVVTAWDSAGSVFADYSWAQRRVCSRCMREPWTTRGYYTLTPIEEAPQP